MSMKMRFVALGVASVLVLALWFGAVYKPASAKLSKLRADVTTAENQRSQLQAELLRLQALKKDAPNLRAKAAKFTTALPNSPAVSNFIRLVQDAADKAHVGFLSVTPSLPAAPQITTPVAPAASTTGATPAPTATPSGDASTAAAPTTTTPTASMQVITISLTSKGSFFAMKDFVHRMEHLPRALRVSTFSISGASGGDLSVSMNLSIFVAPATSAAGPSVATNPAPGA